MLNIEQLIQTAETQYKKRYRRWPPLAKLPTPHETKRTTIEYYMVHPDTKSVFGVLCFWSNYKISGIKHVIVDHAFVFTGSIEGDHKIYSSGLHTPVGHMTFDQMAALNFHILSKKQTQKHKSGYRPADLGKFPEQYPKLYDTLQKIKFWLELSR